MATKPKKIVPLVTEFNDLLNEIKGLEAQIETLKKQRDQYSDMLVARFSEDGIESLGFDTDDGPKKAVIAKAMWAKLKEGVDTETAVAALKKHKDFRSLIKETWNASSLSALYREYDREQKEVPQALQEIFTATPTFSIRVTKG